MWPKRFWRFYFHPNRNDSPRYRFKISKSDLFDDIIIYINFHTYVFDIYFRYGELRNIPAVTKYRMNWKPSLDE